MRVQISMKSAIFQLLVLPIMLSSLCTSCVSSAPTSGKMGVVVSILPQAEFVENVGGELVRVTVMVPPGASPHTHEPTPSQMIDLSEAELYSKVGSSVEFELAWMDKLIAQNEDMLVVDCSQGVQLQKVVTTNDHEHEGHENEHEHGAIDPHIWMSPLNAQTMVQNIADGLIQIDPDNRTYYEQKRDAYLQKLDQLDQDIREGLSGVKNRVFMVYHPAFGYFAEEYGLTMLPIEEEGKEPTAAGIAGLIEEARESNIKVIFVEPQFNPQSAQVIADEAGISVVFIDPLARDYIDNLRRLLSEMVEVME